MQKYFHDVKRFVEINYPEVKGNVIGDVYPPPWYAIWLSTVCGWVWLVGILVIFAGNNVCKSLGIEEPQFMVWISNNRVQTFVVLFLMNNIASSLMSTGAFEVYLDGNLIFSKLETKRFPHTQDLVNTFAQYGLRQN
jgi:selT/selW/selH-like putative selenoprotein